MSWDQALIPQDVLYQCFVLEKEILGEEEPIEGTVKF